MVTKGTRFASRDEAIEYIGQAIENHGLIAEDYDIAQIADAVLVWDLYPALNAYSISADNGLFWDEVDKAEWSGEYKRQMAKDFPAAADEIVGRDQ